MPAFIPPRTTGKIILDAIEDLHAQEQVITHDSIAAATGCKLTIVNDHVARLLDEGKIRRVSRGVFVPALEAPPARSISATLTPNGVAKLEIGDLCIDLWPREARMIGALFSGLGLQFSSIQGTTETSALLMELCNDMKHLRRRVSLVEADSGIEEDARRDRGSSDSPL